MLQQVELKIEKLVLYGVGLQGLDISKLKKIKRWKKKQKYPMANRFYRSVTMSELSSHVLNKSKISNDKIDLLKWRRYYYVNEKCVVSKFFELTYY